MKTHELKTWPEPFSAVWDGRKRFEVRLNDRSYETHDRLILREFDPGSEQYSGRRVHATVTYKLDYGDGTGLLGLRPGYVCLSIVVDKTLLSVDPEELRDGMTV